MELHPPLAPSELDESDVAVSEHAADFLMVVAREHARFIDALARASSMLAGSPGRLAPVAASHARSIQQFLDAQRAVLAIWAETDARVARIVETTELDLALLGVEPPEWPTGAAARGLSAPSVDTLDGRLRSLLDEWWSDGNRHAALLIEEARTRNAALLHVARVQVPAPAPWAAPVVGDAASADPGPDSDAAAPYTHLPASIVAALDAADPSSIDAVLATLLQQLADPAPDLDKDRETAAEGVIGRDPAPDGHAAALVGTDEAFDRFWGAPRPGHASPRRSLFAETVFAVGSVVAVLTVFLAWIG